MPVEKFRLPYIFALQMLDSCLRAVHTMHIFCQKRRNATCNPLLLDSFGGEYPQTHSLWITFAVDEENPPKSALPDFW